MRTEAREQLGEQGRGAVSSSRIQRRCLAWTLLHCPPQLSHLALSSARPAGSGFPLHELTPSQEHFYQAPGTEEAGIWEGVKRLGKNLPPGISFLHLPGINCAIEVEALQLHGELLRATRVEANPLPVPPRCGNAVLKGPREGEESSLSRGSM